MRFEVTAAQHAKVERWNREQDALVLARQRDAIKREGPRDAFTAREAAEGRPYYGAAGGSLTYCFTPTGVGINLTVRHNGTGAALDVTDYESW